MVLGLHPVVMPFGLIAADCADGEVSEEIGKISAQKRQGKPLRYEIRGESNY